jgi:hypothetical protein
MTWRLRASQYGCRATTSPVPGEAADDRSASRAHPAVRDPMRPSGGAPTLSTGVALLERAMGYTLGCLRLVT